MFRTTPLPQPFAAQPFSTAAALDAGVGAGRLRDADLERVFRGARTPHPVRPAHAYAPLLSAGDRFSHTTAAALWGAPIPEQEEEIVHVTVRPGGQPPRRPGIVGHEGAQAAISRRAGLPVSGPIDAFRECAGVVGLDALVAIGDHLVLDPRRLDPHDLRPYALVDELRARLASTTGRSVRAARAAAELVRPGVESPRETRLRLLLWRAGLPEPVCGYELRDARGRTIGWFDLAWPERRVIAEYDGDQHRTSRAQYDRDISRFDRASEIGWQVVRVRSRGLDRRAEETVDRVRAALARV